MMGDITFSRWKALAMHRLITLAQKYRDDRKKATTLNALITKLHYLRSRDLATFLSLIHHASVDVPEVLELIPSVQELKKMLEEG